MSVTVGVVLEASRRLARVPPAAEARHSPSLFPPPLLSFPIRSLIQLGSREDHCKLPQRGLGRSPSRKRIGWSFWASKTRLVTTKLFFLFICWANVLHSLTCRTSNIYHLRLLSRGNFHSLAHLWRSQPHSRSVEGPECSSTADKAFCFYFYTVLSVT